MVALLAKFLVTPITLLAMASFVPGVVVESVYIALIVAIILGVLHITIRPLLLLFTLPVTILTLGLFVFILDALLLWFVSSFIEGFAFDGFLVVLLTAVVLALAHWLADLIAEQ